MTETVEHDAPAAKTESEKPKKEKRISGQPVGEKEQAEKQATDGSPPEVTSPSSTAESA